MIKYISILSFIIKMTDNKNIEDFNDKLSDIGYFNFEKYEEKFLKKFGKNENIKKYYEDFEEYFSDEDSDNSCMNDYIKNNLNKIILGDCLIEMKKIKKSSIDIIICDPPYNIGKDFGNNKTCDNIKVYLNWCDKWITECFRVLKPNGTLYIYGFSETLAYIRTIIKYNVKWLIWHYTNKTVPSKKFWQISHESILCCYKEKPIFNTDDVREPYTKTFLKNSAGKTRNSTKGRFSNGTKETKYKAHKKGALPRDVIKISALAGGAGKKERVNHPTQKPLQLCEKLLKASVNKNIKDNLLLVPFAGSGSECLSAKKLGINYIGFEINKDYVTICKKRLNE
jgi:site-specific DNA-methyltransferase (adenine-specific)